MKNVYKGGIAIAIAGTTVWGSQELAGELTNIAHDINSDVAACVDDAPGHFSELKTLPDTCKKFDDNWIHNEETDVYYLEGAPDIRAENGFSRQSIDDINKYSRIILGGAALLFSLSVSRDLNRWVVRREKGQSS